MASGLELRAGREGAKIFLHYLRGPDVGATRIDTPGESFYRAHQAKSADEVHAMVRYGSGGGRWGGRYIPAEGELQNKLVELWTDRPAITAGAFDRLFAKTAGRVFAFK